MMPPGIPVQGILFTVFQSILQVFLLCLAGFTLSFKGIVDKRTSKVLNHLNIALFTPALLFSKVAFFLSPGKLRQLWVIPIFFVVITGLSAVVAHWLTRAFRLKRSQINFATAASMFMNSNSLPVALMQSLVTTVPLLKWDPDDTVDAMFGRSLTYLVVFSTLGMILRWSYGIRLLSIADDVESHTQVTTAYRDADEANEHTALTSMPETASSTVTQLVDYETEPETDVRDRKTWRTRSTRSRPRLTPVSWLRTNPRLHSHLPAVPTSLGDQSESEDSDEPQTTEDESEATIVLRSEPIDTGFSTEAEDSVAPASSSSEVNTFPTPRWSRESRLSTFSIFTRLLNIFTSLSPPLVASLLALFCVLVPPVQRFLESEEMIPFKGALDNAGACSIPITLIVLGGWFWDGPANTKGKGEQAEEREVKGGSGGQRKTQNKGKGVAKFYGQGCVVPTLLGEQQNNSHESVTERTAAPRLRRDVAQYSRDSLTTSLSSVIGSFGDVLMAHIYPRGKSGRAKRRFGRTVGSTDRDVEQARLAIHTEMENESAENGPGHTSRSRSWSEPVNGHARQPTSSSALPPSKAPRTQGTNLPGETLTIVLTLLARMVIVPLVATPMMILVSRLGWGGEVFEDPVFIVSSMLLVSSPPALTLAQISQRAKKNAGGADADADAFSPFERLLSRTVFWAYLVLTPPITIASVMVGLLLVEI